MAKEYSNGTLEPDPAHEAHGDDAYHARGHVHDNSYFTPPGHHVTAADKPENEYHGHASSQEMIDTYRREMDAIGAVLDKPVQDKVAAADAYAHGNKRGR